MREKKPLTTHSENHAGEYMRIGFQ